MDAWKNIGQPHLHCQSCCHSSTRVFRTKPGSSTCGIASIPSFLHREGLEQNGAKQRKGPLTCSSKNQCCQEAEGWQRRQKDGRGTRGRIPSSSGEGKGGKIEKNLPTDSKTSQAGLQRFHRTPAQHQGQRFHLSALRQDDGPAEYVTARVKHLTSPQASCITPGTATQLPSPCVLLTGGCSSQEPVLPAQRGGKQ